MIFSQFIHYLILFSTNRYQAHAFHSTKKHSITPFSMSAPKITPEGFIQEEPFTHQHTIISPNTTTNHNNPEPMTQQDLDTLQHIKKMMKHQDLLKLLQSPYISQHHKLHHIEQYEIFSTAPYSPNLFNGLDW